MGSSKLGADLYLAWRAAVVHPLRRLLDKEPQGKERFLANYGPEGLVPTTPRDKAMLAAAGRCISCGLCDQLDGQLGAVARGEYQGASLLPRQYARSSVELHRAKAAIEAIDPAAYRAGEAVCPTRVPLVAIAAWLQERLARVLSFAADEGRRLPPSTGC
ncbi:(Fe-S)-binding protein [Vulgatibacter sp.]|uniref:(Fe-S)-binding protein n=1 Tax=Vulgatibacter sp. TaxID=1971226 RepID=UPI00356AC0D0